MSNDIGADSRETWNVGELYGQNVSSTDKTL